MQNYIIVDKFEFHASKKDITIDDFHFEDKVMPQSFLLAAFCRK